MNPKKTNNKPLNVTNYLLDKTSGFFVEEYFSELLTYERKRTERSRRPFLLMLLDIDGFSISNGSNGNGSNGKEDAVKKIASALFTSTREVDVKGWYKNGSVIGILFTELNGIDKASLREKVYSKLYSVLEMQQVRKIETTFYAFPDDENAEDIGKKNKDADQSALYPELTNQRDSKRFYKRVIDVSGSIAAFIMLFPLFLLIAIIIKVTSEGPIFFRQERIGQFGRKFTFLKFRTMHANNNPKIHQEYIKKFISEQKSYEANGNGDNGSKEGVYKIKDDPRVTPIGKLLRKTSLDELPQFINVLKGEMSLVGPRPPVAYEVDMYDLWHRRRIMEVQPGITGLWQTKGRSSTTFNEMVRLDIRYIKERSLWLDIKLIILTPWVVLTGKGAY